MRKIPLLSAIAAIALAGSAAAGDIDKGAVIGGAAGGGVGAAIGSKVGGTAGAAIGGALGGGVGAAIGSDGGTKERVVVRERTVVREVEGDGPPGHRRGKKKGWKKHHDHDD